MSEVKRRARAKYFEQELWNNLSKQNSFQDRLLNLKTLKIDKDENIVVRALDSEQLLMSRRKKKLHDLRSTAETCKRGESYHKTTCHNRLAPIEHLPRLPHHGARADRPLTTGRVVDLLGIPSSSSNDRRCRSHSDLSPDSKVESQEDIYFPSVSSVQKSENSFRNSHSTVSLRLNSLSDSDLSTERLKERSWTRPSVFLHERDRKGF